MSIILQNRSTGLFVAEDDWNAEQANATNFPSGIDAYDHCRNRQLSDMDIILAFRSSDYNVRVPVRSPAGP